MNYKLLYICSKFTVPHADIITVLVHIVQLTFNAAKQRAVGINNIDEYLLLNLEVSLLRKDIRPDCPIADVSCACDGTGLVPP